MPSVESLVNVRQARIEPETGKILSKGWRVVADFDDTADAVLHAGYTSEFLKTVPSESIGLVISSPPYNIGKEYEARTELSTYLESLKPVLEDLVRVVKPSGSICWQVGNYVEKGEVFPLDMYFYPVFKNLGLKLRNRVVWYFGHGLHASKRFSGRYETLLWFTKSDNYTFNLDAVRVPAKYPGKRFYNGTRRGQISGNPLGKNPSDFWVSLKEEWNSGAWDIPNVKSNHPEKSIHPCQFPIELVERCVLALTTEREWVLDPYGGVGSAAIAALKNGRRGICVDKEVKYVAMARQRITDLQLGRLRMRRMGTPVYQPTGREKIAQVPKEWQETERE